jgi:hypothetical protein
VGSPRRHALGWVLGLLGLVELGVAGAARAGVGGRDDVPITSKPVPWKRWKLFDPRLDPRSGFFVGGVAWLPLPSSPGHDPALHLAVGDGIRTEWGPVFVESERSLRITAPHALDVAVRLPCYTFSGGLHAGPFELQAGVGLSVFGVDTLDRGVAFSFFSPGATARATVVAGRVRASVQASTEYLWRWFDRRDIAITSLALQLAIVNPPSRKFGSHPLDVQE